MSLMNRNQARRWFSLFISFVLLMTLIVLGWNFVAVREYRDLIEAARMLPSPATGLPGQSNDIFGGAPWGSMLLGMLGFALCFFVISTFFLRLLKEMRLNQMQAEFLARITHELKTPIATMELTSSLLRASASLPKEEVDSLWNSHDQELKRLREEVELLLEAARWEGSSSIPLQKIPLHVEAWLTQSLERWKTILGPDAQLSRTGDPLDESCELDPKALNLIADNILDNARKYALGKPEVEVVTHKRDGKWWIEFRDRGWGFDPEDRKRIFDRFFRARTRATRAIPGTGLGLYLAQTASRALGLKLRGESAGRGMGSTFIIEGRVTK